MADDFCKEFLLQQVKYMIENKKVRHRNKLNHLRNTEIIAIYYGGFDVLNSNLIINDKGEILNFMFILGNVDDREPLKQVRS